MNTTPKEYEGAAPANKGLRRDLLLVVLVLATFVGWGTDHFRQSAAISASTAERETLRGKLDKLIGERQSLFYALNEAGFEANPAGSNRFEIRSINAPAKRGK